MTNSMFVKMDERNKAIAAKVIVVMYFLTIIALQAAVMYRQLVLDQSIHDMEDLAIILTANSIFLVTALLYFGAVPLRRIKPVTILLGYVAFVILGSLFTYLKYNVFQQYNLSIEQLFDKVFIVASICALLVLCWLLFYWLGNRRLDKELED